MNKAPKEQEVSFFHIFNGEKINSEMNAYGKCEVTVFFEDEINEVWVSGTKVDLSLPWKKNNIYTIAEMYLAEMKEIDLINKKE